MIQTKGPRDRAIVIFVALFFANCLLFHEIKQPANPILYLIIIIIDVLGLSMIWGDCKTITIGASGCTISVFFLKKFYPWRILETIRFLDFGQERTSGGKCQIIFCEGVLFCKKRINKYPHRIDPETYAHLHHPFSLSCFYIQFTPTNKYSITLFPPKGDKKQKELPCFYPVDRASFLACIEKWGVKVEGLNAPYPPEEVEQQKKRR